MRTWFVGSSQASFRSGLIFLSDRLLEVDGTTKPSAWETACPCDCPVRRHTPLKYRQSSAGYHSSRLFFPCEFRSRWPWGRQVMAIPGTGRSTAGSPEKQRARRTSTAFLTSAGNSQNSWPRYNGLTRRAGRSRAQTISTEAGAWQSTMTKQDLQSRSWAGASKKALPLAFGARR